MMQRYRVLRVTSTTLAGLLWMVSHSTAQHQHSQPAHRAPQASAATPQEQALEVGKKGDVEFRTETIVGDLRLTPGRYQVQHRVDGADHFVHFTELTKADPHPHWGSGGGATKAHPGEVKCRLEPLEKKVSTTTVHTTQEGDARRVTRLLVRGENVAHLF